jgi:hypothetical protein
MKRKFCGFELRWKAKAEAVISWLFYVLGRPCPHPPNAGGKQGTPIFSVTIEKLPH